MDCRNFEEIVGDLACDRLLDAAARKSALIHAAVCERCARRLAAERALTAGLLEFAEATADRRASPRVKQQLRAAVAERKAPQTAHVGVAPVISIASRRKTSWPRWALAAAATILAFIALTMWWWQQSAKPANEELANEEKSAPAQTPSPQSPTLDPVAPTPDSRVAPQPAKAAPRRSRALDLKANDQELASEFIPLTLAADEQAMANGTLVRLEMSRDKLIAMGLPLQVEGGRQTVNAEVMMGDNGVAYAIRVVR